MNEELTKKLRDEFPILFGPNEWKPDGFLRGFGFECDDGWYELIREFGLKCKEHRTNQVIALIVKEKFGRLTVQGLTNMTDELWSTLGEVGNKSEKTCEICGKPGCLSSTGYWLKTVCKEHSTTIGRYVNDNFKPVKELDDSKSS